MKNISRITKVLFSAAFSGTILLMPHFAYAQSTNNIALNKNVTFNHAPNYSYSTDPEDNIQLTDGEYTSKTAQENKEQKTRALWVQKGTVGWTRKSPVVITIDLGEIHPISGASFNTAAGSAGVRLPTSIQMAVSDDGKTWTYIGNLILMSNKNKVPPAYDDGYAEWRYVTHELQTKGRFITFGVDATQYVFSDEIEVYEGNTAWINQPAKGRQIDSIEKYTAEMSVTSAAQWRISDDVRNIQQAIEASDLSSQQKSTFIERLQKEDDKTQQMGVLPKDFRTIFPINDIHHNVLSIRGEFLAAQGLKPLTIWKQHRYAWLPLLATPDTKEKPELNFSMLRNQFRSDSFLLTNATKESQTVELQLRDAPKNAQPGWLEVSSVAWTDTAQGTPVADALFPVQAQNGMYSVEVPAGMTRKVWFTVDSSKVPAGSYKSTFIVDKTGIPLMIGISDAMMNQPRLSLGMWDYTDGKGKYAVTPDNQKKAIALMQSHFVDTPWATRSTLPWPPATAFNKEGNLISALDFAQFDEWISMWKGARRYLVYASVSNSFAGAKMGTDEFNARVGSWAKALSAQMRKLDLNPSQLGILLIDEPHKPEQEVIIAAWAKAIKAAAPEITLFSDPNAARAARTENQESLTTMDILCPTLPHYQLMGKKVVDYFQNMRAQGKELWFYQCSGPVRMYSPQRYYRHQAWHAFEVGATGQGFWSFADISNAPSSFSEYGTSRINYAPVFFDGDKIYNSIHWDSVREGMEDYEELAMLQDAIDKSTNTVWKNQAQQILNDSVKGVTNTWTWGGLNWNDEADPTLADTQLIKVREVLNRLQN